MVSIHPTAIISDGAVIGEGTTVGPYSIIGPKVTLGKNNVLSSHVVIEGNTSIGDDNRIFQFASIGSQPQDLKYAGEDSRVVIGNKNTLREYVTIQPGTSGGGMVTTVGDSNLFMVSSHVGHDGHIGNQNVIANGAAIAGHVHIGNRVILGGLTAVHQFCRIGDLAMLGGGAMITSDIIPFSIGQGDRARICGVNAIGMERAGIDKEEIGYVRKVYKKLFLGSSSIPMKDRLAQARLDFPLLPSVVKLIEFIESSERGVAMTRRGSSND